MPSFQLQTYLHARATGATVEAACAASGIDAGEAALHEADIASGELELPRVCARAPAPAREGEPSEEETIMSSGQVNEDALRLFIERIDRLDDERKGIADDMRDVYAEAKAQGFDTWAMKEIRKWRRLEAHTQQERATLLELYAKALGVTVADPDILKAA